jgi:hypothetical protein
MKTKTKPTHGPAWKPKKERRVLLQVRVSPVTLARIDRVAKQHGNRGRALDVIMQCCLTVPPDRE